MNALDNLSDNAKAVVGAILMALFALVGVALLLDAFGVLAR